MPLNLTHFFLVSAQWHEQASELLLRQGFRRAANGPFLGALLRIELFGGTRGMVAERPRGRFTGSSSEKIWSSRSHGEKRATAHEDERSVRPGADSRDRQNRLTRPFRRHRRQGFVRAVTPESWGSWLSQKCLLGHLRRVICPGKCGRPLGRCSLEHLFADSQAAFLLGNLPHADSGHPSPFE